MRILFIKHVMIMTDAISFIVLPAICGVIYCIYDIQSYQWGSLVMAIVVGWALFISQIKGPHILLQSL